MQSALSLTPGNDSLAERARDETKVWRYGAGRGCTQPAVLAGLVTLDHIPQHLHSSPLYMLDLHTATPIRTSEDSPDVAGNCHMTAVRKAASEPRSAFPVENRRADFGVEDPFIRRECSMEWGPSPSAA
eukprot:358954-Chlamydomonas_euryale.AAC.2